MLNETIVGRYRSSTTDKPVVVTRIEGGYRVKVIGAYGVREYKGAEGLAQLRRRANQNGWKYKGPGLPEKSDTED